MWVLTLITGSDDYESQNCSEEKQLAVSHNVVALEQFARQYIADKHLEQLPNWKFEQNFPENVDNNPSYTGDFSTYAFFYIEDVPEVME